MDLTETQKIVDAIYRRADLRRQIYKLRRKRGESFQSLRHLTEPELQAVLDEEVSHG